jgi:hypothetical protein
MFVTVVAFVCHMIGATPVCVEEIVTDSTLTDGLTFQGCLMGGQAPLAAWKAQHPIYRNDAYTIERYMCVQGHYEPRGRA